MSFPNYVMRDEKEKDFFFLFFRVTRHAFRVT